jgi:hypothetical protein
MAVKNVVSEDDELMLVIQIELDKAVTKDVCDAVYETASLLPKEKTEQELDSECKSRKSVIMNVIANSVNLERLYFIIRSSIMGLITGLLTFAIISILDITDFLKLAVLGIFIFIISLVTSRVLDKPIVKICNKTILFLKKHNRIKNVILKRL